MRLGIVTDYDLLGAEWLHLTLGLSIPTGSIKEGDRDVTGQSMRGPYSMQLGTGTFDLLPGVTWLTHSHPRTLGLGRAQPDRVHRGLLAPSRSLLGRSARPRRRTRRHPKPA